MPITIRNIDKEKDLEAFVEFINLAHEDYPDHQDVSKEYVVKYIFESPDFDDRMNFLAFDGHRLIGRGRGDLETDVDGSVTLQIIPEYRSDELRDMLYEKVINHLAKRKLKTIRTQAYTKFNEQIHFFEGKGFQDKWRHYSMTRDMGQPLQEIKCSNIEIMVPDLDKEYKEVRDTIDMGFSDTMDSTEEMMVNFDEFANEEWFLKDGIIVAKDDKGKMMGVCVASIHPAMKDRGHIPWLAVLKNHRGKGLGKALLLSGLAWLKDNDTKEAILSVEIDNPNALNLYKSCGFKVNSELRIMEKKLS